MVIGGEYAMLETFSAVFGMSCLQKRARYDISRKLNQLHEAHFGQAFGASVIVLTTYRQWSWHVVGSTSSTNKL